MRRFITIFNNGKTNNCPFGGPACRVLINGAVVVGMKNKARALKTAAGKLISLFWVHVGRNSHPY